MVVRIELSTGEEIVVRGVELRQVQEAFEQALARNQALDIRNASGRVLALNPRQILSIEQVVEDPHATLLPVPAG